RATTSPAWPRTSGKRWPATSPPPRALRSRRSFASTRTPAPGHPWPGSTRCSTRRDCLRTSTRIHPTSHCARPSPPAWTSAPNNPTGRMLSADFVEAVLRAAPDVLVCIDEAYYEISGVTLADLALRYPNAVLVRTFSKGYGLAGARVGYLVGQRDVTQTIESI